MHVFTLAFIFTVLCVRLNNTIIKLSPISLHHFTLFTQKFT